jgi:GntR family transcriptional repressor for pyruvate dehydrogenase complex
MDNTQAHIIKDQQPQDVIIRRIRQLLQNGELKPGMRLPSERKMAEESGISRLHVRAALQALESYGIVETRPQSGTFIVGLDINALDGLFADVLKLDAFDFAALAEMRAILEVNAARFCAERRTEKELDDIHSALQKYEKAFKAENKKLIYTTDFEFHRCIAAGCGNSTLRSMLLLITPDIMSTYQQHQLCVPFDAKPLEEHRLLYRFIKEKRPEVCAELMKTHLDGMLQFANLLRKEKGSN